MKKIFFLLFTAITCNTYAQSGFSENVNGAIKLGAGYVHEFAGLNGISAFGEYSFPLNEWLQGSAGIKRIQTAGYPRTQTVKEYTKATTLDFSLLFVPLHSDNMAVKIGAGYSFSFYNTRRSYPVYDGHADLPTAKQPNWQISDAKGRAKGISLIGEYEYYFQNNFSLGARVMVGKAYTYVIMASPFVSVRF